MVKVQTNLGHITSCTKVNILEPKVENLLNRSAENDACAGSPNLTSALWDLELWLPDPQSW